MPIQDTTCHSLCHRGGGGGRRHRHRHRHRVQTNSAFAVLWFSPVFLFFLFFFLFFFLSPGPGLASFVLSFLHRDKICIHVQTLTRRSERQRGKAGSGHNSSSSRRCSRLLKGVDEDRWWRRKGASGRWRAKHHSVEDELCGEFVFSHFEYVSVVV